MFLSDPQDPDCRRLSVRTHRTQHIVPLMAKVYYSDLVRAHNQITGENLQVEFGEIHVQASLRSLPPMRAHKQYTLPLQQKYVFMCMMFLPREAH